MSYLLQKAGAHFPVNTVFERAVLAVLCELADDDGGNVFPSQAYLVKRTCASRASIGRAIAGLEALGVLKTIAEADYKTNKCAEYSLQGDRLKHGTQALIKTEAENRKKRKRARGEKPETPKAQSTGNTIEAPFNPALSERGYETDPRPLRASPPPCEGEPPPCEQHRLTPDDQHQGSTPIERSASPHALARDRENPAGENLKSTEPTPPSPSPKIEAAESSQGAFREAETKISAKSVEIAPAAKPKKFARISRAIQEGEMPNERQVADAHERGFAGRPAQDIWEKFRDHHLARGTVFKDWDAAWRTWLANEIKFASRQGGTGVIPVSGGVGRRVGNMTMTIDKMLAHAASLPDDDDLH